jgi:Zn-dependent protease with chaperone function
VPHLRSSIAIALVSVIGLAVAAAGAADAPAPADSAQATKPALDPALIAASRILYKRELDRARAAQGLNLEKATVGRARRDGQRLVPRANAIDPSTRTWDPSVNVETRTDPIAWSLPNGEILLTTGVLQMFPESDAEFAAILAHLMAHTVNRDDVRTLEATVAKSADPNRLASELADALAKLIVTPHYDDAAEIAADRVALEILARSGIDPAAAARAWRKVEEAKFQAAPGLAAMHRVTPERLTAMEARAVELQPNYELAQAMGQASPPKGEPLAPPRAKATDKPKRKAPATKTSPTRPDGSQAPG